jgi:hypothetical protein
LQNDLTLLRAVKKELAVENDRASLSGVCRHCGSKEALAAADAQAIGLLDEFVAGIYSCCQVVQWADEQWVAWQEAGCEDGKAPEEGTSPLEVEPETMLVPVRLRKPKPLIEPNF